MCTQRRIHAWSLGRAAKKEDDGGLGVQPLGKFFAYHNFRSLSLSLNLHFYRHTNWNFCAKPNGRTVGKVRDLKKMFIISTVFGNVYRGNKLHHHGNENLA